MLTYGCPNCGVEQILLHATDPCCDYCGAPAVVTAPSPSTSSTSTSSSPKKKKK